MIYIILDTVDRQPVLAADSLEKVKVLLDDYMGMNYTDNNTEYLGFEEYIGEYYDAFEGIYTYREDNEEYKFIRYYMTVNDTVI